ncbi:MAG: hypothetical protein ACJAZO_005280 [Myxococcota bacterium]|jgi:hypothetical protein
MFTCPPNDLTDCPVSGDLLARRARVNGANNGIIWAISCPTCGRFSVSEDVRTALESLDDPARARVSALIASRNTVRPRGQVLSASDLAQRD